MRRRDRRGSAAIEFAIVASAFLAVMMAVIETGYQMAVGAALEHGARQASRFASGGLLDDGTDPPPPPQGESAAAAAARREAARANRWAEMQKLIVESSGVLLVASRLALRTENYNEGAIGSAFPGAGTAPGLAPGDNDPGSSGQVVFYALTYTQPLLTPFARGVLGRAAIEHRVTLVLKNEPFPRR
jgi:hypothetical protein